VLAATPVSLYAASNRARAPGSVMGGSALVVDEFPMTGTGMRKVEMRARADELLHLGA